MDALLYRLRWPSIVGMALVVLHASASSAHAEERGAADMLTHIVSSAGIFFGPLLLIVSICLATLFVLLVLDLRLGAQLPPKFVQLFTAAVSLHQYQQAYSLCRANGSCLARVLTAGMGRLQYGLEDARQAAANMLDSVRAGKEQLINYLGTIGTLGPMIGLVGTVF
ncbi:MAG TPA: MotA/TolQ/ExbB proton channel family protein, partial [Gemmataceae bacterium]|nr:MotA/TolQ/ExbB proton channel family protein [Gemmataceae bacterium]